MAPATSVETNETAVPRPRSRRRSTRKHGRSSRRSWLRPVYFAMSALWGYAIGAAALIAGLAAAGNPVEPTPLLLGLAVPGALAAVAGGLLSAAAYRDARRRWS